MAYWFKEESRDLDLGEWTTIKYFEVAGKR